MAFEPIKADDLALVNRLLLTHPDLQDTIAVIKQVSLKAKYPIASFDDLSNALGGESGQITFRGRTITMAEARSIIPAYYFPIASEADLTAKMADLGKALPPLTTTVTSQGGALENVIRLLTPSAIKPSNDHPQIADQDVLRIAGFGKERPGTGGLE